MFPSHEDLKRLQKEQVERVTALLYRLPIADVSLLGDSIEQFYATAESFQSATGSLAVAIMKRLGLKVRVAEWHMVNGRCEHKRYSVGKVTRARHGEIGDETWLEAWIA